MVFFLERYLENLITGIFLEILGNLTRTSTDVSIGIPHRFLTAEQMEIDQATYFVDSPFATDFVSLGGSTFHPSLLYKLKDPPVLLLAASFVGCHFFCHDPFSLTTSAVFLP